MNKNNKTLLLFFVITTALLSCKKFLAEPPDKKLAIPSSIRELQALLDNYSAMNDAYPNSLEVLADNYYLLSADWSSVSDETMRNLYLWQRDDNSGDWFKIYTPIKIANTVIDNLDNVGYNPATEQAAWNTAKGSALFYRAFYLYAGTQLFAQPYDKSSSMQDLGMALRLTSDFNEPSVRSTVQQTYEQIIGDLKEAAILLPQNQALKTRPSKSASYGALARTYLAIQQYDSAGRYADLCLKSYGEDSLLNFATEVSTMAVAPIKRFNKEVIFHCKSGATGIINNSRAKIDSNLYRSYAENDLRKTAYFKENTGSNAGTFQFKADYDGSGTTTGYVFGGIITDEMYLTRAECFARTGNVEAAMADLNKLMKNRWKAGLFVPYTANDAVDALTKVLTERRKELLMRGTRWTDLRRLIKEAQFNDTLERTINGQQYKLSPNSERYTLLIPIGIIELTGMQQNP